MYNYEIIMENLDVIKTACARFRKEMTVISAMIAEKYGMGSFEDYIRFIDELSDDVFLGIYCLTATNTENTNVYRLAIALNSIIPLLDRLHIDDGEFYRLLSKES